VQHVFKSQSETYFNYKMYLRYYFAVLKEIMLIWFRRVLL